MTTAHLGQTLIDEHRALQQAIFDHPFVQGIASGDLSLDAFIFYLRQDYRYLIEFSRVLALAVAKARDLPVMSLFAESTQATLGQEMELHRDFCRRVGIAPDVLAATPMAPTTYAYTRHLLATAYDGSVVEIMAATLPCQWGYWDIGQRLIAAGAAPDEPFYAEWIQMYADPGYGELVERLLATFDALTRDVTPDQARRLSAIFETSLRYELAFWEMGLRQEGWPD